MKNLLAVVIGIICIGAFFLVVGNNLEGDVFDEKEATEESAVARVADMTESFHGIDINGPFEVRLIQSDHSGMEIQASDKDAQRINSEIKNGILKVWMEKKFRSSDDIKLIITSEMFDKIGVHGAVELESQGSLQAEKLEMNVSGACEVELGLEVGHFDADISGAGDLELEGSASSVDISISGAGNIDAEELNADRVEISISGAGHAEVHANEELDVSISGVGSVSYSGDPSNINKRISGMGSLSKN